jgi:hypothetical protein
MCPRLHQLREDSAAGFLSSEVLENGLAAEVEV